LKQLHVYDFDKTLYDTPAPKQPAEWLYLKNLEQAGPPGFDARWKLPYLLEARRSLQSIGVVTILLTGRPDYKAMRDKITSMLRNAGADFNGFYLKPLSMNCPVQEYKAKVVSAIVDDDPLIDKVIMYDDYAPNLEAVKAAMAYRNIPCETHLVKV
jgi:hypothetical protein